MIPKDIDNITEIITQFVYDMGGLQAGIEP